MNNNIQEDYCSFEVSKLLKEKGFGVKVPLYFRITGSDPFWAKTMNWNDDKNNETAGGMTYISNPTHALAIKWIRENFGFHIYVSEDQGIYIRNGKSWGWTIIKGNYYGSGFSSPEEATETALLYTLKNLI